MTRTRLLTKKTAQGMCVAVKLFVITVIVMGCQVPPAPQAQTAQADNTALSQPAEPVVETSVPVDTTASVTQDVAVEPAVQPDKAMAAKPVVAAVELAQEDGVEPPAAVEPNQPSDAPASPTTKAIRDLSNIPMSNDAKIYIVEKVCDFGETTPMDRPRGVFQIKNIGTDTLYLTDIKLCCGAQHELTSDELAPGETSELTVIYTTGDSIGAFEKYLYVYSNDISNPEIELTIKGKVVRRLEWTPSKFRLFLNEENGGCLPVTIKSTDGKPFSLTTFIATEDCLAVDIDPNKVATEFKIYPKVDLEKLGSMKMPKGIVRIKHTHPGCDTIVMNFDLSRRYAFTPKRFLVLNADPKRTKIQRVNIIDNYAESVLLDKKNETGLSVFTIESVECAGGTAVLKSTKQIEEGYQLTFEITTPPYVEGARMYEDVVRITLSTGDELQIPVNGIYSLGVVNAGNAQ